MFPHLSSRAAVLSLAIAHGISWALFNGVDVYLVAEILKEGGDKDGSGTVSSVGASGLSIGGWRLSALLGSWLGPVVGALTLFHVGHIDATERYHTHGYTAWSMLGACYTALAFVLLRAKISDPELLVM
jgi:hypothetical protein